MVRYKVQILLAALILSMVGVTLLLYANVSVQAGPAITPTLAANSWSFLPVVRGLSQAPPATATLPGPTQTASPTFTPTPTNTPEPGRLASPTLFDILNDDHDGNFAVGWSMVPSAEYYKLERRRNSNAWKQIYEGPNLDFVQADLSNGQYCYRVMALNVDTDSEWSAIKCTSVISATSTSTATNTPRPGELTAPIISDIDNADGDGNFAVEWSSVSVADEYILREGFNGAEDVMVYRGPNLSFGRNELANGEYCYRVRAIILGGEWGPWSNKKCTIVGDTPSTPDPLSPPIIKDFYRTELDTDQITIVFGTKDLADCYQYELNGQRPSSCLEAEPTGNADEYQELDIRVGNHYGETCVRSRAGKHISDDTISYGEWGTAHCTYLVKATPAIDDIYVRDPFVYWSFDPPYYLRMIISMLGSDAHYGNYQVASSLNEDPWALECEGDECYIGGMYGDCAYSSCFDIVFFPEEIGVRCYKVREYLYSEDSWGQWSFPSCLKVIAATEIKEISLPSSNHILIEWSPVDAAYYELTGMHDGFVHHLYDGSETSFLLSYSGALAGEWCFSVQAFDEHMGTPESDEKCIVAP